MRKKKGKKKRSPASSYGSLPQSRQFVLGRHQPFETKILFLALLIGAAILAIYWPAFHGEWLWDDDVYITDNLLLRNMAGLWTIWSQPGITKDYYPIEATAEWVQWHLWGLNTLGYHLTNVALHIVSSLLVWRLLSRFQLRFAWLGGLLFAIHPVQVESVAWAAELKNTLSMPFLLAAFILYLDYDETKRSRHLIWAVVFFALAVLCKISVVFMPVVILLHVWWKTGRIQWKNAKVSVPFFAVALAVGLATVLGGVWARQFNYLPPDYMPEGGWLGRFVLAGLAIAFYFSKVVLPVNLLPVYPLWPVNYTAPLEYLPWLVLGIVIYVCWRKRQTWGRHVLFGLGFFLINLAPCPGFIPSPNMGYAWVMDHFLYLPIVGLIALAVAAVEGIERQLPKFSQYYFLASVGLVMLLLAWQSWGYANLYSKADTFWTYTIQRNPMAWIAYSNLGYTYLLRDQYPQAEEQLQAALRLKPEYAEAHSNLGKTFVDTDRIPEAIEQYKEAIHFKPIYAVAHNGYGYALIRANRTSEAIDEFKQATLIQPDYADAYSNLGNALCADGRASEAIDQYKIAVQLKPDYTEAHCNYGSALLQLNRIPEAIDEYQKALQLNPNYGPAHTNLGRALLQTKRTPEAIEQFQEALQIDPKDATAQSELAQAQALLKSGSAAN